MLEWRHHAWYVHMRYTGKITDWKDDKGFGFITPTEGGHRVFAHITAFKDRRSRPLQDDTVTYAIGKDNKGRLRAVNVVRIGSLSRSPGNARRSDSTPRAGIAMLFVAAAAIPALTGRLPVEIFLLYPVLGAATFFAYTLDKFAARNGYWRIPEVHLHLLALAGGWPGALIAQEVLRHKTRKVSFLVVFWITALLNAAAFAWLFTSDGAAFLDAMRHLPSS